ncbi:energy transducer TonB [Oceanicoccus sp. KOV_DT_Chl]|uniref:energy transducer TonB n=1 Tax=Oceanicoccus sp. KOV_DT_Chl TaxID=1904639 RepID=UPI000C7A2FDF|nr:energy transducer TonB [Oceanicoccus sp. KOV_DT_Chl]
MEASRAVGWVGAVAIQGVLLSMVPTLSAPQASGAVQANPVALSISYQRPQNTPVVIAEPPTEPVVKQRRSVVKRRVERPVPTMSSTGRQSAMLKPAPTTNAEQQAEPAPPKPVTETAAGSPSHLAEAELVEGVHRALVTEPLFARAPAPPHYPRLARKRGQQGTVWVDVVLDNRGQQIRTDIFKSSGVLLLDRAALEAVEQWQFLAHRINHIAVASQVRIPVEFSLE